MIPLHRALMRNLGVTFNEICNFEELAADCHKDGQWDFLYVAALLKVTNATGSPSMSSRSNRAASRDLRGLDAPRFDVRTGARLSPCGACPVGSRGRRASTGHKQYV